MSPIAEKWEQKAAEDLVHFIELMTDVKIPVIGKQDAIDAALESNTPLLIIGREAINANPNVFKTIEKVLKKNPQLQTDGVVLIRKDNHIYLVGNTDRSHYYAVVELLRQWGCRWYMPTGFGECIPDQEELSIGNLSHVYSSMSVTQINVRIIRQINGKCCAPIYTRKHTASATPTGKVSLVTYGAATKWN